MPYTKQTWVDGQAGGTPLSAARLNYMEQGIEAAASSGGLDSGLLILTPEAGRGYGLWWAGGTTVPVNTLATVEQAFMPTSSCTLTRFTLEVTTGVASATILVALYTANPTTGLPISLVESYTPIDASTTGQKTSVVSTALTGQQAYVLCTMGSGGATVRGWNPGSTGADNKGNVPYLHTSNTSSGGDNLARGYTGRFTPAVNGVFDASPSPILSLGFKYHINIGIELS